MKKVTEDFLNFIADSHPGMARQILLGEIELGAPEPKPLRIVGLEEAMEKGFHHIEEPFWYNTWSWDIPNTMIGLLRALAGTRCKKVTMVRGHGHADVVRIQAVADEVQIEIDWMPVPADWLTLDSEPMIA